MKIVNFYFVSYLEDKNFYSKIILGLRSIGQSMLCRNYKTQYYLIKANKNIPFPLFDFKISLNINMDGLSYKTNFL